MPDIRVYCNAKQSFDSFDVSGPALYVDTVCHGLPGWRRTQMLTRSCFWHVLRDWPEDILTPEKAPAQVFRQR
jgi:hypothetical protein